MQTKVDEVLELTERVVNIDSGSYDRDGVNQVQDIFEAALSAAGFTVSRLSLEGAGDQLTARWNSGNSGPKALILGHADTVWPAGTTADWKFERSGDFITGPGVGDMKVSVVNAIVALRELLRTKDTGVGSITFLIVPDEEIGSAKSSAWIESEARQVDFCVTLEPARPNRGLVIGRGAVGHLQVEVTGVTAHVAHNRREGASAIAVMAQLIPALEAISDESRALSVSVGLVRGGEARQVVPAIAVFEADLRAASLEDQRELLKEIEARIATIAASADPRIKIGYHPVMRPPFAASDPNKKLFGFASSIAEELGIKVHAVFSPGGSDASFAAAIGTPTIDGLGPITHEMCSRRERAEVHSISTQGALLGCLVRRAGLESQ
jgi:glutamate carboxypeptidase